MPKKLDEGREVLEEKVVVTSYRRPGAAPDDETGLVTHAYRVPGAAVETAADRAAMEAFLAEPRADTGVDAARAADAERPRRRGES